MKTYSKEELDQLVSKLSDRIYENSVQDLTDSLESDLQGKSYNDILITMASILYQTTQLNTKQLIVETLDEILND